MNKHFKFLVLSATVLASAQVWVGASEAVLAQEKEAVAVHQKRALPQVGVSLKPLPAKYTGQPFKDISHSIFKNYINAIYKIGVTTGYTKTTYEPNKNVNRGEMASFLYRMAGSPSYNPPFNVFTDINDPHTPKKQILWLSATGITNGTGSRYYPHDNVTRGQMAAFLHRMAVKAGKAPASGKYNPYYADAKKHMFVNDIGWLRSQGITDVPKSFKPDAAMTRGEMAAFLSRFYNKFNKQSQPVVNQTSLKVKDSTLYVNDSWKAQDNFVSATDKNGKAVVFSQVKVSGKVDTSKAGTYTITYSYGGKTATAKVIVKDGTEITLAHKIITLYEGDSYSEQELRDNITGLINKEGKDVLAQEKDQVKITAQDAHKRPVAFEAITDHVGTYTITYSYDGYSTEAIVTVKDGAAIKLKETEITKGVTAVYGDAELRANIIGLTDKTGQNVLDAEKANVTITAKAGDEDVDLNTLTQKEGDYTITYSYGGKTATLQLVVDSHIPVLSEDKTTVNVLNQTWSVLRSPQDMGEGNYLVAGQEKIGDSAFNNSNRFFESDEDNCDGYATSNVKTMIDQWYTDNVEGTTLEQYVQPVILPNPTLGDMKALGVLTSTSNDIESGSANNWWQSHDAKYRTTVDATNGKKQAFVLSSADVSGGVQNGITTNLTPEAVAWKNRINNYVWLRSPGTHNDYAANVSMDGNYVGGHDLDFIAYRNAVVSALVVHVE